MTLDPSVIPSADEISQWLAERGHPTSWADWLTGLPWRYIEPIVSISANSGNHPAITTGVAIAYSGDPEFRRVAGEHIEAKAPTVPRPNRAARRAAGRSTRRAR